MSKVSPRYVKGLADLGYHQLAASDLAKMKDAGITLRCVSDLAELGHMNLSLSLRVKMRESDAIPSLILTPRDCAPTRSPCNLQTLGPIYDHSLSKLVQNHPK
jgi:hypothetical protein